MFNDKTYGEKMVYVYLIIAIVSEVFGTTFLKASQGFTVLLPTLAVVCGYGLAFYFLSLSLSSIPVGIAYAVWSGLGVVLISLMGGWFTDNGWILAQCSEFC